MNRFGRRLSFVKSLMMALTPAERTAQGYFKLTDRLWNWYASLDENAKNFRHAPGSWSVNDVFRHLLLVEELLIGQVSSRLSTEKVKFARLKHRRNAWLLLAALWIPKKYKVPAAAAMDIEIRDFDLEMWKVNRAKMMDLLKQFPTEYMEALVFKHPAAGPIRLVDGLNFLKFHVKHHYPQLRSLAKAGSFGGF